MDGIAQNMSTLDYINTIYIRYFYNFYQDISEENFSEASESNRDDSELSETDFSDIDHDFDDRLYENEDLLMYMKHNNRQRIHLTSKALVPQLRPYIPSKIPESEVGCNADDKYAAHGSVTVLSGDPTLVTDKINFVQLDYRGPIQQCNDTQRSEQLTESGLRLEKLNKNGKRSHGSQCQSSRQDHDSQCHSSRQDIELHEPLQLEYRDMNGIGESTEDYVDGMAVAAPTVPFLEFKFSKSCDCVDALDSEDIFHEHYVQRRHSAPGILPFDTSYELNISGPYAGHNNFYNEAEKAIAVYSDDIHSEKTVQNGNINFNNIVINDSNRADYAVNLPLNSTEGVHGAEASFDEESMELYFKDFGGVFDDEFGATVRDTGSSSYSCEHFATEVLSTSTVPSDYQRHELQVLIPNGAEAELERNSESAVSAPGDAEKHPQSGVALNLRNRKKKAKLKKKRERLVEKHQPTKPKNSKFADTLEELFREEEREIDDALACPVCWEVFYNPYICRPCSHVFCEPCLRKIARCNKAEKRDSPCPICREPIQYCTLDYELGLHIRSHLPYEHNQRKLQDGKGKHMSHPLPSKPVPLSYRKISGLLATRRNRRNRSRLTTVPVHMDFWRFLSLVLVFLLFKAVLLLIVLFVFNIGNSYVTGERLDGIGSLFKSVSSKFVNRDRPQSWFWGCAFLSGCIVLLFATRHIYKWLRLKLQI